MPTEHDWKSVDIASMTEDAAVAFMMSDDDDVPTPAASTPQVAPQAEQLELDVQIDTAEPTDDLSAQVAAQLGMVEEKPQDSTTENKAPVDAEKLKELDALFQETLGVPISGAVEQMTNFASTVEQTLGQIEEAKKQLAYQMQELELRVAWANDPSVVGKNLGEVVQSRIAQLTQVYGKLNPEVQAKLAQQGAQGILTLWNVVNGGTQKSANVPATVPQGRANIAPGQPRQNANTLSEVISLNDDNAYWQAMQQLRDGQVSFNNDVGL